MSNYNCCPNPNCGRKAKDSIFSFFFVIHTCSKCDYKYCNSCGDSHGSKCPSCGSPEYVNYDKLCIE